MPVSNARQAAEIAREYVEDVLRRGDLLIEQVEFDEDEEEWVVTLGGLGQDYALRIDADNRQVLEFSRVAG